MKKPILSFLAGFAVIFLMALTTDQIIQKVYDSSNTALRVNLVTGGGGAPTGCSIAAGRLTCTGFTTSADGSNSSPAFANPSFGLNGNGGVEMQITLTGSGDAALDGKLVAHVFSSNVTLGRLVSESSIMSPDDNDTATSGYSEWTQNNTDSDWAQTSADDFSGGTAIMSDTGSLNLAANKASTGIIRLYTNGKQSTDEKWRITAAGVLESMQTGLSVEILEGSAPSGVANNDLLYGDSTAHRLAMNNNNGTAINVAGFITGTASITPGTITASQCADSGTTITVTGAVANDPCSLGPPAAGAGTHISATCYISGASTATVRFCNSNTSNQTGTTGTYRATVVH